MIYLKTCLKSRQGGPLLILFRMASPNYDSHTTANIHKYSLSFKHYFGISPEPNQSPNVADLTERSLHPKLWDS